MKIGEVAKKCNLSIKAIRYYEEQGLIQSTRLKNGYREYSGDNIKDLKFIQHARELGFGVELCRELLILYRDPSRASAHVRDVAIQRLEEVESQINRLLEMKVILSSLVNECPGNQDPQCNILDALADIED